MLKPIAFSFKGTAMDGLQQYPLPLPFSQRNFDMRELFDC
jgi:hypothetical protein